MSHTVFLEQQAEKELRSLTAQMLHRIDNRLLALSEEPWPTKAVKIKGKEGEGWRIKVGDYRILYTVDESQKLIKVYRIKHRREAYR